MCFYLFPTVISTLLLPKRKVKFKVTPKGLTQKQTSLDLKLMRPIIILLFLNLGAVALSMGKAHQANYFIGAEVVNLLWAQFITIVLGISIIAGIDLVEEREGIRVKCRESCKINLFNQPEACCYTSQLVDVSESGVAFLPPETLSLAVGQTFEFSIPGEPIQILAKVERVGQTIGCSFPDVTMSNIGSSSNLFFVVQVIGKAESCQ
jgi:hypothetical protein